jgi:hypothetical protein
MGLIAHSTNNEGYRWSDVLQDNRKRCENGMFGGVTLLIQLKSRAKGIPRDAGTLVWSPRPCCSVCQPHRCFRNGSFAWQKEILSLKWRRAPPMALSNPPAQRCSHLLFRHTLSIPFPSFLFSLFTQSLFFFLFFFFFSFRIISRFLFYIFLFPSPEWDFKTSCTFHPSIRHHS